MKGYAHYIWSSSGFVLALLIITSIVFPKGYFIALISANVLLILAIAIQTRSSKKEREYRALKGKTNISKKQKKKMRRSYLVTREISVFLVLISLALLIFYNSQRALFNLENFEEAMIMAGFLFSYIGSIMPDSDLMLGIENHRNKWTHSSIIPSVVVIVVLFFTSEVLIPVCMFLFGLTVGAALHLFCDVVPDGSNVREAVVSFFKWVKSPGDIRGIKESKEQAYLIVNGLILAVHSVLLVLRSLSFVCDFPPIVSNGIVSISIVSMGLFIFTMILFLISLIVMRAWRSTPRKTNS